ncbi:hypothetical protein IFM89_026330 [Coptis chinensis]|uniref:Uncharacterized protein n=1 Tax=Coptis chinensis TaxID=261450 RepID=A0A835I859_9MAGN|nr:hypothetical protein IFM89_026330 [Coptis chinensis]
MNQGTSFNYSESDSRIQPFDAEKHFPESESDLNRNYSQYFPSVVKLGVSVFI